MVITGNFLYFIVIILPLMFNYLNINYIKMDEVVKKIRVLAEKHGVSSYEIGEKTSVSTKTAYNILNSETISPRKKTLNIVLEFLLGFENKYELKEEWHTEKMIAKHGIAAQENEAHYARGGVPFFDVDFATGFDLFFNDQTIQPLYYVTDPYFKDCDFIARASGKSMERVIKHGEAVGFKIIDNWKDFFTLGEIYGVVTKNDLRTIKIVSKGDNNEHYTLISKPYHENKDEFKPQPIPKKMIRHVFRVVASKYLF